MLIIVSHTSLGFSYKNCILFILSSRLMFYLHYSDMVSEQNRAKIWLMSYTNNNQRDCNIMHGVCSRPLANLNP